jgi:hypothetical protein
MPEQFKLDREFEAISAVQQDRGEELFAKPNVVGVALGHKVKADVDTGDACLTVFVSQKLDPSLLGTDEKISATMNKFKTDVVETGDFFAGTGAPPTRGTTEQFLRGTPYPGSARPDAASQVGIAEHPGTAAAAPVPFEEVRIEVLRNRVRPVEGGFSVGHYRITAGTMATAVYDVRAFPGIPRRYYVLSNNHVLANSNDARVGDPILQPGPIDGGTLATDRIARLSRFVPIRFNGPLNLVDAAIAEAPFHVIDREIYWIGYVQGVRMLTGIGDIVQKTGRTTNYTTGRVTNINATVNVNYGGGNVARMARQIVTTNMSAPGDSGSLLCDTDRNAVGLLFAGSATRTIHNHIMFVKKLLGIQFATEA